jgi:hypothetical protein
LQNVWNIEMVYYFCAAFYSRLGVKDKFAFLNTMAAERIIRSFFMLKKIFCKMFVFTNNYLSLSGNSLLDGLNLRSDKE